MSFVYFEIPCMKTNVVPKLEFELAFVQTAVKHFSHYSTMTPFQKQE